MLRISGNWKLVVGVLAGALAGGAVVYADGGDAGQVHACLIDGAGADGRPNTIILGPNDTCPGGTTPKHWAIQGPAGAPGETGAKGETGVQGPPPVAGGPDPPTFVELVQGGGFKPGKQLKVVKKSTDKPQNPFLASWRSVTSPHCPASHPKRLTGGYQTSGIAAGAGFFLMYNGPQPNSLFQWTVNAVADDTSWTLTAYQVCTKK